MNNRDQDKEEDAGDKESNERSDSDGRSTASTEVRTTSSTSHESRNQRIEKRTYDEIDEILNLPFVNPTAPRKRRPPPPPIISEGGRALLNPSVSIQSPKKIKIVSSPPKKINKPPSIPTPPLTARHILGSNSSGQQPSTSTEICGTQVGSPRKTCSNSMDIGTSSANFTETSSGDSSNKTSFSQVFAITSSIAGIDFAAIQVPRNLLSTRLVQYDSDDDASVKSLSVNKYKGARSSNGDGQLKIAEAVSNAISTNLSLPNAGVATNVQSSPNLPLPATTAPASTLIPHPSSVITDPPLKRTVDVATSTEEEANLLHSPARMTSEKLQNPLASPLLPNINTSTSDIFPSPCSRTSFSQIVSKNSMPKPNEDMDVGGGDEMMNSSMPKFTLISSHNEYPELVGTTDFLTDSFSSAYFSNRFREWREGLSLEERYKHLWVSPETTFDGYYDIVFEIGQEKVRIPAHLLMLSTISPNFQTQIGCRTPGQPRPHMYQFPKLEPVGFEKMIKCVYGDELETNDICEVCSVLEAARAIGFSELINKCQELLKSILNVDNVVECYYHSVSKKYDYLRELATDFIKRNTWDIFFSDKFVQVSEVALTSLLQSDDLNLDEVQVFQAVKRWALAKIKLKSKDQTPTGVQLREAMGSALHCIRFPTMSASDFLNLELENKGLLNDKEAAEIYRYLNAKQLVCSRADSPLGSIDPIPQGFNCVQRIGQERTVDQPTECNSRKLRRLKLENQRGSLDEQHHVVGSTHGSIKKDESNDDETGSDNGNDVESTLINAEIPKEDDNLQVQDKDKGGRVPKKRKKRESSDETEAPCNLTFSPEKIPSIQDYLQSLTFMPDVEKTEKIDATLKLILPSRNPMRLYLPHLKDFHLTLIPKIDKQGSAFKQYCKGRLEMLSKILFFDKINGQADLEESGGTKDCHGVLEQLLAQKTNITITVRQHKVSNDDAEPVDILFLKINHNEGVLLMHLIKDAQKIINGAKDFPLKVLAISDCDITNLDTLQRNELEVIVMRRVKGLKNHADFLKDCTKLREVCWNDLSNEKINLSECLLTARNQCLVKKISLAKCQLTVSDEVSQLQNYVEELYLDNCTWDQNFTSQMPKLFPYLKRVQVYGHNCDSHLIHSILTIKTIQWIFAWDFIYQYVKGQHSKKKKTPPKFLTDKSEEIQNLLIGVFGQKFAKQEKVTFILERKPESNQVRPGTSHSALNESSKYNQFDCSNWSGMTLGKQTKYYKVNELDYLHNSYNEFYPTYKSFQWSDTSEKDLERKIAMWKKAANNPSLHNNDVV